MVAGGVEIVGMTDRKPCMRCGHLKEIVDYPEDPTALDGRGRWCQSCTVQQEPDWSIGNLLSGLGLHLPLLAYLSFIVLGALSEAGAGTSSTVIALAIVGVLWLVLAALVIRWWRRGRPDLAHITFGWFVIAILGIWVVPLLLIRPFRRWLGQSLGRWPRKIELPPI